MTDDTKLWDIEELLWTGGTDALRNRLAPACLMSFPGTGVLEGEAILDSLKDAPRWQQVAMDSRHLARTDGLAVLCYTASALRDGDAPYRAMCSSTWARTGDGWRLVQHQQTPLDALPAAA
ncbi:nuclear transport factor 2 family protein [Pseudooceanicola pacificus]|nr:nuclear transport factor 2 family protein [Pseudooceanicola pacificus]